ncbi:hypothetical protein [Tumebacillus avium]|nr:hypothetical protein [Tumebacillus avium]
MVAMTFSLSTDDQSVANYNFAATISSIILAVVAILFTFWDVAGQNKNIRQMQNIADNLSSSVEDIKLLEEISINNMEELAKYFQQLTDHLENQDDKLKKFMEVIMERSSTDEKGEKSVSLEVIKDTTHEVFETIPRLAPLSSLNFSERPEIVSLGKVTEELSNNIRLYHQLKKKQQNLNDPNKRRE